MPATAILALPYPVAADSADVPRDIKALADKLETYRSISVPLAAALPGSPVDGQEIVYQSAAMATDGVAWHLRYRSGAPGSFKWEFVGGAALYSDVLTQQTIGGTTNWIDLATVGPQVTLPLAGDYEVALGAELSPVQNASTAAVGIGYGNWGPTPFSAALANVLFQMAASASGSAATVSTARRLNGAAAAALLKARYWSAGGAHAFANRWLTARPIRVG